MNAAQALADRRQSVREAAHGWHRAGVIDEPTLRAIRDEYPDDRVRLSLGLRILAGLAALVGGAAFIGFVGAVLGPGDGATIFFLMHALLFVAATELQLGRWHRRQSGSEFATAILAVGCAIAASSALFDGASFAFDCAVAAVLFAAAAWRWGYAAFAAVAAAALLVVCADGDAGRAVLVLLGLLAVPMVVPLSRQPRWTPAHRRCLQAAAAVFLMGAYLAVNLYSVDHHWVEGILDRSTAAPGPWARGLAVLGTILMPPVVLLAGLWLRDPVFIATGAVFATASLVTFRHYVPVGPWWTSLIFAGACCLALAVALRRWLEAGPAHERAGYTAEAAFEDDRHVRAAQLAATALAMSPSARPTGEATQFTGGGGRSGGGGASGSA